MKKFLSAVGIALMLTGTSVAAGTLQIVGGTASSIPGVDQEITPENDVLEALFGVETLGGFGAGGLTINANRDARLRIDLIGFEAGNTNTFEIGGQTHVGGGNPNDVVVGDPIASFFVNVVAGVLDFEFTSTDRFGNPTVSVANGFNPDVLFGEMNFFASLGLGNEDGRSGESLLLFLDDAGQSGGDNHDDLAIRISTVPLPAGALLLLTGMGALAIGRRRRKAA